MTEETTTAAIVAGITGIVSAAAFKKRDSKGREKRTSDVQGRPYKTSRKT